MTIASPTSAPPGRTLSRPDGRPASSKIRARATPPATAVRGSGLRTTALPRASAGATARIDRMSGKLNGEMTPTTPIGTRRVMLRCGSSVGRSSPNDSERQARRVVADAGREPGSRAATLGGIGRPSRGRSSPGSRPRAPSTGRRHGAGSRRAPGRSASPSRVAPRAHAPWRGRRPSGGPADPPELAARGRFHDRGVTRAARGPSVQEEPASSRSSDRAMSSGTLLSSCRRWIEPIARGVVLGVAASASTRRQS